MMAPRRLYVMSRRERIDGTRSEKVATLKEKINPLSSNLSRGNEK